MSHREDALEAPDPDSHRGRLLRLRAYLGKHHAHHRDRAMVAELAAFVDAMIADGAVTGGKFQYTSSDYTITLDAFGDVGARITGSFSGALADANGVKVWLLDGKFDIKR